MTYEPRSISDTEWAALDDLDDWRVILRSAVAVFRCPSFSEAAALVGRIGLEADRLDHHPDLDLRDPGLVRVVLTTHAVGGLTELDVELARSVSALAGESGARAEAPGSARLELALDTMEASKIRPFWAAVLGYREDVNGNLSDPARIGPPLWFQQLDAPRPGRGRFHLDVSVPHDVAAGRIEAALAAGGTLVTDRFAPAWWVLADADGNEACICTWQGR
ncbi:MAG: VOC family protein [Ilumatobacteraceae bacterium]